MENVAITAKVLGNFFYFPLDHENNKIFISALKNNVEKTPSLFSDFILSLEDANKDALYADFQLLFEGSQMPAPPWGSVYLDREKVIFGDSTLRLRQFLSVHNMLLDTGMREPEDQFGLTLMALASIIEQTNDMAIACDLLGKHLLPWAFHYLELAQGHSQTKVYRALISLTANWLKNLQMEMDVTPHAYQLYL